LLSAKVERRTRTHTILQYIGSKGPEYTPSRKRRRSSTRRAIKRKKERKRKKEERKERGNHFLEPTPHPPYFEWKKETKKKERERETTILGVNQYYPPMYSVQCIGG